MWDMIKFNAETLAKIWNAFLGVELWNFDSSLSDQLRESFSVSRNDIVLSDGQRNRLSLDRRLFKEADHPCLQICWNG
jgi:hypothetical protein